MDKQNFNYDELPYTGHSGVLLNDHLRGVLGRIPRVPGIVAQKAAAQAQKEMLEQKHLQEQAALQSARDQVAQIAAARQHQAINQAEIAYNPNPTVSGGVVDNLRRLIGH